MDFGNSICHKCQTIGPHGFKAVSTAIAASVLAETTKMSRFNTTNLVLFLENIVEWVFMAFRVVT